MNDDQDFLRAILGNPEDDTLRLVYADWLEEQGDPRAEFLRLEALVAELPTIPKDQPRKIARALRARMRLEDLLYRVDSNWRAVIDRTPIENCQVRFGFKCPKKWQSLQVTEDAEVRFCEACRKKVYYCSSVEEARDHAKEGHCVAVESRAERRTGDLGETEAVALDEDELMLGMIDEDELDLQITEMTPARKPWWRFW